LSGNSVPPSPNRLMGMHFPIFDLLTALLPIAWQPVPPGEVAIFVEAQIGPPGPDGIPHRWDYHLSRHPSSAISQASLRKLQQIRDSLPIEYIQLYNLFKNEPHNLPDNAAIGGAVVIFQIFAIYQALRAILLSFAYTVAIVAENAVVKLAGAIDKALYRSVGLPLQVVSEAVLEVATQLRHVVTSLENIGQ
jgi:hypothetical protein